MIRRPPRSTLFPTRRSSDLSTSGKVSRTISGNSVRNSPIPSAPVVASCARRSEEHTSELQSHHDLVCRLLLEKKKKKKQKQQTQEINHTKRQRKHINQNKQQ